MKFGLAIFMLGVLINCSKSESISLINGTVSISWSNKGNVTSFYATAFFTNVNDAWLGIGLNSQAVMVFILEFNSINDLFHANRFQKIHSKPSIGIVNFYKLNKFIVIFYEFDKKIRDFFVLGFFFKGKKIIYALIQHIP
jgi:hypothetical protein